MIANSGENNDVPPTTAAGSAPLTAFYKRRLRTWLKVGLGVFVVVLLFLLLFLPQTYTARLSLAFVQPSAGAGGILSLVAPNGGSPSSKYIGIVKSRTFAEDVVRQMRIQELLGEEKFRDTVDILQSGLLVVDNPRDGLFYISVSLPGPSYLAPGGAEKREKMRQTVADSANLYTRKLRSYLATHDTDNDSVLMKGAGVQVKQARADYDEAVGRLIAFVRTQGEKVSPEALAGGARGGGSGAFAASNAEELQALYIARATLEAELQAAKTAMSSAEQLQGEQMRRLENLPSEDPLLMQARAAVNEARTRLENDRVLLGPEHPRVQADKERLEIAERILREQSQSVKQGYSTPKLDARVKLDSMEAKYASLNRQIQGAESKVTTGTQAMAEFDRLRNEVLLRLEILKAAASQTAVLSLQAVSAQDRFREVDVAIPPEKATPKLSMQIAISLVVTAAGMLLWIVTERNRFLLAHQAVHAVVASGNGAEKLPEAAENGADVTVKATERKRKDN